MVEHHPEVEIIERRNSVMVNVLATVGAGLIIVLLSWVAFTQTNLQTSVAVVIANQENIVQQATIRLIALEGKYQEHEGQLARIWPRLRTLESNQGILATAIKHQHPDLDLELRSPPR